MRLKSIPVLAAYIFVTYYSVSFLQTILKVDKMSELPQSAYQQPPVGTIQPQTQEKLEREKASLLSNSTNRQTAARRMLQKEANSIGLSLTEIPKKKILLLTTWRSGSTFLGELLNWFPGAFYTYEPLVYFDKLNYSVPMASRLEFLRDVYECEFSSDFMRIVRQRNNKYVIANNKRYIDLCRHRAKEPNGCLNDTVASESCRAFPIQLVKTVRHRAEDSKYLLETFRELKIVVLLRDPRGTFNSRKKIRWCMVNAPCGDPQTVCDHFERDIAATQKLIVEFPNRVHLLRYEDLSLDPVQHAQAIYRFLELPFGDKGVNFVKAHTSGKELAGKHSTFHDSRSHVFKWRHSIEWEFVQRIQSFCENAMKQIGYQLVTEQEDLNNETFSLLSPV